jgi:hypothetical protein
MKKPSERLFFFNGRMTLSSSVVKNTSFDKFLTNGAEVVFKSNTFDDYNECVRECSSLCNDVAKQIQRGSQKHFLTVWEPNPLSKAEDKPSMIDTSEVKPWDINEIVRFYLINPNDTDEEYMSIMTPMMTSIYSVSDVSNVITDISKNQS